VVAMVEVLRLPFLFLLCLWIVSRIKKQKESCAGARLEYCMIYLKFETIHVELDSNSLKETSLTLE